MDVLRYMAQRETEQSTSARLWQEILLFCPDDIGAMTARIEVAANRADYDAVRSLMGRRFEATTNGVDIEEATIAWARFEVERGRAHAADDIYSAGLARRNTDALRQARLDALLEQGRLDAWARASVDGLSDELTQFEVREAYRRIYEHLEQNSASPAPALDFLLSAVSVMGSELWYLEALARLGARSGRYADSYAALRMISGGAAELSWEMLSLLGEHAIALGLLDAARAHYRSALRLQPDDLATLRALWDCCRNREMLMKERS